ncbi:MAG: Gfo/Idh/MocA family oxidoreductase [bacterium]
MDKVRLGIIGFGGMGSSHGRYLAKDGVPKCVLTAVADIDPKRLELAKEISPDVQVFDTADALFAANVVDAVLIATPHYFHPPLAIQAFSHGLHVLSEKPAGVYTKQVREMNEAAAASGLVFGLMFNQRTMGAHQKMRDLVQSGEIGEIRRVCYTITDWFRSQAYYNSGGWRATWEGEGGGVLINQCPHNLDLFQWIVGMPTRIFATCGFGKFHKIEVEDSATAMLEFPNGATGLIITTTGEAPGTNTLEIAGDRGKLVLTDGKITFWRTRVSVQEFLETSPEAFQAPEVWKCEIPTGKAGDGHQDVTKAFVGAILNGTPLTAGGEEGINGLSISNAIHLSAWTDKWVNLPVDEDLFLEQLQQRIKNSTIKKEGASGSIDFDGSFKM